MIATRKKQAGVSDRWEHVQQPVHGTGQPADYFRLLAALDEGWQIVETAEYLAHGTNAEGHSYLLTLLHPHRLLTREWTVTYSPEMEALLGIEGVPGLRK